MDDSVKMTVSAQPALQPAQCHLLDMPVELLERMAFCLDPSTLISFRKTCNSVASITRQCFARACLKELAFVLSDKTSMQALVNISAHPVYSKSVQRLPLSLATLAPNAKGDESRRQYQNGCPHPPEEEARRDEQKAAYLDLKRREDELGAGPQETLLETALRNFINCGNTPAILADDKDPRKADKVPTITTG